MHYLPMKLLFLFWNWWWHS